MAAFAVAPASDLAVSTWRIFQPYLQLGYLNHGYHFFAPEPGPSHLIRYELTLADGSTKTGYFPNSKEHQPRLLYHRHFMLSEHLAGMMESGAPSPLVNRYIQSYGEHLLDEYQAEKVKLTMIRHHLADPEDVLKGMKLTDASLYAQRELGTFVSTRR